MYPLLFAQSIVSNVLKIMVNFIFVKSHMRKFRFSGTLRFILVLSQVNNPVGFEFIVRIAQQNLKVSHKPLTSVTD